MTGIGVFKGRTSGLCTLGLGLGYSKGRANSTGISGLGTSQGSPK